MNSPLLEMNFTSFPTSDWETREKIVFDPSETLDQDEGDREPPHHFRVKWEGSKKFSTLIALDEEGSKSAMKKLKKKGGKKGSGGGGEVDVPRDVTSDDNGEYVPGECMKWKLDQRVLEQLEKLRSGSEVCENLASPEQAGAADAVLVKKENRGNIMLDLPPPGSRPSPTTP